MHQEQHNTDYMLLRMERNLMYVSENEELNYTFRMVLFKCHLDLISQRYSIKHQIRLDIMYQLKVQELNYLLSSHIQDLLHAYQTQMRS